MDRTQTTDADVRPVRGRSRRYSIRTSLVALVAACVLPSLGALAILVYEDHLQNEDAVHRETQLRARSLMATIDRDLATVQSSLQALAASNRIASSDLTSFAERLRKTPRSLVIMNYVVIDQTGRQLLNTAATDGVLPSDESPSEELRVFESGEPSLSDFFEAPVHHRTVIAMTVPVRRDGEVVLGLVAELALPQINRILEDEPLPDGWVAGLVDRSGTIVARSRSATRFVGQKAGRELRKDLLARLEGTIEAVSKDGFMVISAHARSSLSGLSIVVNSPKSALASKLSSSIALLIGGGALVLGLALWFAIRLAGNVSRSVEGLIDPALALGSGRPIHLAETTLKEADAVGRAIEQAGRMLAQARHQAHHDALTGLCNRVLFDEVAAHQLAAARRSGQRLAVLAIDLDGFKAVNDRHGHAVGDTVLKLAAERIEAELRASDVVSRRGGDEFTVLLCAVDEAMTRAIGDQLVASLAEPYPAVEPRVSASIGIAMFPESGYTLETLLARADAALYEAKKSGKRRLAGDVARVTPLRIHGSPPTATQRAA